MRKTDIILLAAGDSKRYGTDNKLLAHIEGKPMFTYAVDTILQAKRQLREMIGRIVVVSKYEEIEEYIKISKNQWESCDTDVGETDCILYCQNDYSERGISESIHLGTQSARDDHAMLFFVCDQPGLKVETMCELILNFARNNEMMKNGLADNGKKAGVITDEEGRFGNPCIFAPCLREKLLNLTGDKGGKTIIANLDSEEILYVQGKREELMDIDYRE